MSTVVGLIALALGQNNLGPGQGPWVTATPESQGLSQDALVAAAAAVNRDVAGRKCFAVVKNGKLVHEQYYGSTTPSSVQAGWSTTKSLCSTMFGIATEQRFAEPTMRVADTVTNTRRCNKDATFKNVLSMTGTSPNMQSPRFAYDTLGTDCYDVLSEFVAENNPEGLDANAWKEKHFFEELGMEHTRWSGNSLTCGAGAQLSCRDLARTAQLWVNEGEWPGAGQLMNREHAIEGTEWVYPNQGDPYGYGVRLRPDDPVDPKVAFFGGILVQCAFFSKEHQAIVVSMGDSLFQSCQTHVWEQARSSIVSKDHALWAATRDGVPAFTNATYGAPAVTHTAETPVTKADM